MRLNDCPDELSGAKHIRQRKQPVRRPGRRSMLLVWAEASVTAAEWGERNKELLSLFIFESRSLLQD